MKQVNIGLLGCGTVGSGVAKLLLENGNLISSRLGAILNLKYVADLDTKRDRGISFPSGVMIDDAHKVVNDPEIDIIIEMIGGTTFAKDIMLKAISSGKQIVTANKALLASHGNAIFSAARAQGVDLAYEASVGGCMPIIKTIREALVGNHISSMIGILNGTCNYILSKITSDGSPFDEILAKAQSKGYAEANPDLDVEGFDTAHKLAILTALAKGMEINLGDIYIEGISQITPLDIAFATQFGYKIKLLAISKDKGNAVEMRVHPTMIPQNNILSNVNGTLNAITISGDAIGEIMLHGHGAGMMPTASAVISDVVDLARNLITGAGNRIPYMSFLDTEIRPVPVLPIEAIITHYYIRFMALDHPGVLSKISGILGRNGISIESVQQKERKINGSVPLVMLTHLAKEKDIQKALTEIKALDIINANPVLIRIEDENREG